MCVHLYVCAVVYVCTCVCMCVCIQLCVYMYVYVHLCMCVCVHIYVCPYVWVCEIYRVSGTDYFHKCRIHFKLNIGHFKVRMRDEELHPYLNYS